MYFYDDTDDWPEYRVIKDEIHRLEMAHLEFCKKLRQAESTFRSDPTNEDLRARVEGFKKKLKDL